VFDLLRFLMLEDEILRIFLFLPADWKFFNLILRFDGILCVHEMCRNAGGAIGFGCRKPRGCFSRGLGFFSGPDGTIRGCKA
jgi:hypothetical protein